MSLTHAAGAIRLRDKSFTTNSGAGGRLEVYAPRFEKDFQNPIPPESFEVRYGWASICAPDGIDQAAADVACRQLGYERAYEYGGADSLG